MQNFYQFEYFSRPYLSNGRAYGHVSLIFKTSMTTPTTDGWLAVLWLNCML